MHTTYVYNDGKVRRAMKADILEISEHKALIQFDNTWPEHTYEGVVQAYFYRVPKGEASSNEAYYNSDTETWYYLNRDTEEYLLHLKSIYPEQIFNRLFGEH